MHLDRKLIRIFLESALVTGILTWIAYWIFKS